MNGLVQRRPLVFFLALVLVNILLLSLQVRDKGGLMLLRSWGVAVFTPPAHAIHWVMGNFQETAQRYFLLHTAQRENHRLRVENDQLRLRLVQLSSLQRLFSRISSYGLVKEQYVFDTLWAGVIWKSAPFHSHRLLINAGSRAGVGRDAAIITPDGIVGRARTVTALSCEAELITNAGAAAGGMLEDSRLQGVVEGNGSKVLKWNYIPNYEEVEVGDIIYTSGMDRLYPKGLPIGRVIESRKGEKMIYRHILVRPMVDYSRVEEVLVITSG